VLAELASRKILFHNETLSVVPGVRWLGQKEFIHIFKPATHQICQGDAVLPADTVAPLKRHAETNNGNPIPCQASRIIQIPMPSRSEDDVVLLKARLRLVQIRQPAKILKNVVDAIAYAGQLLPDRL